jgi:hypothetical protein
VPNHTVEPLGVNIQVLGHWNPVILTPRWFADGDLLPREEADAAKVELIHTEIAQFETDWFSLSVTKDRLIAGTTRTSHAEALRDLVAGTLDLLSHTPLMALGINHDYTVNFRNRRDFDDFGWRLVPPASWGMLERPGMATLQVQGERPDDQPGYIRVKVEPVLDGSHTAIVGSNDHFDFSPNPAGAAVRAAAILRDSWFDASRRAEAVLDGLFNAALEPQP